jgi:hypothetical protein
MERRQAGEWSQWSSQRAPGVRTRSSHHQDLCHIVVLCRPRFQTVKTSVRQSLQKADGTVSQAGASFVRWLEEGPIPKWTEAHILLTDLIEVSRLSYLDV